MMTPEITMTTNSTFHKIAASNLYESNDILNMTPSDSVANRISAVSFVASRNSNETPWSEVLSVAIGATLNYLKSSSVNTKHWQFFGASELWKQPSVMTRYRKFWGANKSLPISCIRNCSPEVEFTRDSLIRFAVCCELPEEVVEIFGDWIRATRSGFMLLIDREKEQTELLVRDCFDAGFSENGSDIDWGRTAEHFCKSGSILVRFSGAFDDPDAAVDLIYDPRFCDLT